MTKPEGMESSPALSGLLRQASALVGDFAAFAGISGLFAAVLAAAFEGVGLLLLVPLLSVIIRQHRRADAHGATVAVTRPLFAVLVVVRAIIVARRNIMLSQIEADHLLRQRRRRDSPTTGAGRGNTYISGKPACPALPLRISREREIRMKRGLIIAGLLTTFLTAYFFDAPRATARTPFDGAWSVLIVTDHGTCDRAYRYAMRIADGQVYYDDPNFNVSGRVDGAGHVRVAVAAGGQSASGYGRLSGNSGQGSWSGRSSVSQCSGHWEAERRG